MNHGISIILPALNEATNLEPLVNEVVHYFSSLHKNYEIIIINDGSTDRTGEIAEQLSRTFKNVSVIHHLENKGYGKSLRDGFEASRHDYLFFTDADRQFRINSLNRFLPLLNQDNLDMVIGYRISRKDPFLRKILAWGFNTLVRTLFSLNCKDVDCAFKLLKKESFRSLEIKSSDFLFNTELLAKAQIRNLTIIQQGVEHYPRSGGKSTISYKHIFLTLKRLFALYGEVRRFKKTVHKQP